MRRQCDGVTCYLYLYSDIFKTKVGSGINYMHLYSRMLFLVLNDNDRSIHVETYHELYNDVVI